MAGKKYTSLAKGAPAAGKVDGVDNYNKVVGGGTKGGKKKSLGKMNKGKTNRGV